MGMLSQCRNEASLTRSSQSGRRERTVGRGPVGWSGVRHPSSPPCLLPWSGAAAIDGVCHQRPAAAAAVVAEEPRSTSLVVSITSATGGSADPLLSPSAAEPLQGPPTVRGSQRTAPGYVLGVSSSSATRPTVRRGTVMSAVVSA